MMPIAALPTNTVRAIGSAQTLTDSASLIKELIDNAIDGRATSISIEISANALDDIRVKDNGHGIAPEDRAMICQRHCTSKIRHLEDLRDIGGRSLGFRGEALASATEMSGCLTIATRIEGEETASELKFDRQGHIASEKRTSLPVGTTVRVEKFLDTLPVRRQAVEKTTAKLLAKVKRMLQAYTLARPHLRLSLKILKAKNDKGNWKYTGVGHSKTRPSAFDAATETIGKKVTDQCQLICSSWSSAGQQADGTSEALVAGASQDEMYTFEAVLAKFECGGSLISNIGQYVSMDSRPVSCARGTLKQIIAFYKSHLRSLNTNGDDSKLVDPFLCMNIVCPRGSYDANVEPAKDDILFANPDLVLRLAEKFFQSIYGEHQPTLLNNTGPSRPAGIELMLARKIPLNGNATKSRILPAITNYQAPPSHEEPSPRDPTSPTSLSLQASVRPPRTEALPPMDDSLGHHSHRVNKISDELDAELDALDQDLSMMSPSQDGVFAQSSPDIIRELPPKKSTWKPSMYAEDEDDMEELDNALFQQATPALEDDIDEDTLRNVEVSNPWTLTKLNAPFRPPGRSPQPTASVEPNGQLPTPGRQLGDAGTFSDPSSDDLPQYSSPSVPEPIMHRPSPQGLSEGPFSSSSSPFPFPLRARGKPQGGDSGRRTVGSNRERYGRGGLDTWVQRSITDSGEAYNIGADSGIIDSSIDPNHPQHQRDFVSAGSLPTGTPLSDIPDASQRPRRNLGPRKQQQGALNRLFVSPVNDPERVWFNTGEKSRRRQAQQDRSRENLQNAAVVGTLMLRDTEDEDFPIPAPLDTSVRPMHPDLAITMDYEARKQKAIGQRRELLRQQAAAEKQNARVLTNTVADTSSNKGPTNAPHKNRQNKAIAALHTNEDPSAAATDTEGPPAFEAGDPRAYLLKVQQREDAEQKAGPTAPKSKWRKTMMLPFETVREDTYIGDWFLRVETADLDIKTQMENGGLFDGYIENGNDTEAFSTPTTEQIKVWEETLKEMVKSSYRIEGMSPEEEMDGDLDVDLVAILQDHAGQTADLTVS